MPNTLAGGRQKFTELAEVRILEVDGRVSRDLYQIIANPHIQVDESEPASEAANEPELATEPSEPEPVTVVADRKGLVHVRQLNADGTATNRVIKVTQRRILPPEVADQAIVVEIGDRFRAICPHCAFSDNVTPSQDKLVCPTDGKLQLHWLGVKPMVETTSKRTPKPTAPKTTKKQQTPQKLNMSELKAVGELWTKKGIKFDHPTVDVQSHVLLIEDGSNSRKLCFNTYDGTLGKKSPPLPLEDFAANQQANGKVRWFTVKDIEKERAKLRKSQFHHVR